MVQKRSFFDPKINPLYVFWGKNIFQFIKNVRSSDLHNICIHLEGFLRLKGVQIKKGPLGSHLAPLHKGELSYLAVPFWFEPPLTLENLPNGCICYGGHLSGTFGWIEKYFCLKKRKGGSILGSKNDLFEPLNLCDFYEISHIFWGIKWAKNHPLKCSPGLIFTEDILMWLWKA